jgi:hypothetical protein
MRHLFLLLCCVLALVLGQTTTIGPGQNLPSTQIVGNLDIQAGATVSVRQGSPVSASGSITIAPGASLRVSVFSNAGSPFTAFSAGTTLSGTFTQTLTIVPQCAPDSNIVMFANQTTTANSLQVLYRIGSDCPSFPAAAVVGIIIAVVVLVLIVVIVVCVIRSKGKKSADMGVRTCFENVFYIKLGKRWGGF